MSDSSKRLDLRFGAFACSVQGFEDPVQPVQQVLRALQSMLEETPDLAGAGIAFDAEAIEQLSAEVARRADLPESHVEITPGLVIVYHGEGRHRETETTEPAAGEDWDRPVLRSDRLRSHGLTASAMQDAGDGEPGHAPAEDEGRGYVNIFAPRASGHSNGHSMLGGDADGSDLDRDAVEDAGPGTDEDPFEARLGRLADEVGLSRDLLRAGDGDDADGGMSGSELNIFSAGQSGDDFAASLNLFSDTPASDTGGSGWGEDERATGRTPSDALARFDLRSRLGDPMGAPAPEEPEPEPENAAPEVPAEEPYTADKLAKAAHAKTVEDLIVCSAAWMVLMKGQTKFARRDVLEVFDKLPGDHPTTLEAKIKGFGKAVRNGHLIPISDGVFGISRSDLEEFQRLL